MASSINSLQMAVVAALKSADDLIAIVGQRIYDDVAPDAIFPHVNIAGFHGVEAGARGCVATDEITVTVDGWSRARGKQEIGAVVNAIRDALTELEVDLADDCELISMDFERYDVLDDPDGITKHGVVEFTAVVEYPASVLS